MEIWFVAIPRLVLPVPYGRRWVGIWWKISFGAGTISVLPSRDHSCLPGLVGLWQLLLGTSAQGVGRNARVLGRHAHRPVTKGRHAQGLFGTRSAPFLGRHAQVLSGTRGAVFLGRHAHTWLGCSKPSLR